MTIQQLYTKYIHELSTTVQNCIRSFEEATKLLPQEETMIGFTLSDCLEFEIANNIITFYFTDNIFRSKHWCYQSNNSCIVQLNTLLKERYYTATSFDNSGWFILTNETVLMLFMINPDCDIEDKSYFVEMFSRDFKRAFPRSDEPHIAITIGFNEGAPK